MEGTPEQKKWWASSSHTTSCLIPMLYIISLFIKNSAVFQWHCSSVGFHWFRKAILADQKVRCATGLPPLPHTAVSPLMSHAGCQLRRWSDSLPLGLSGRQETAHCLVQGHTACSRTVQVMTGNLALCHYTHETLCLGSGEQGGFSVLLSSRLCLFLAATNRHGL